MLLLLLSRHLRERVGVVPSLGRFLMRLEILILDLIGMGLFYGLSEHAAFNDCVWMVWQTITTVGYGDIPPKSMVGRYGIMVTGLIAILLITYVVSALVEYREALSERRRMGMDTNEEKGSTLLVCCRDEEEMETFIRELRCVKPAAPICIVDDQMKELPPRIAHLVPRIGFVRGSIISPETYKRAGIASSAQVVIFPHQPGVDASDATSQTMVSLAERMAPDVPIIHFLVNSANEGLFEGSRSMGVSKNLPILAAIQECQDPYSAHIFETLMSNTRGANPTTFHPEQTVGWTWGQFVETSFQVSRALKVPVNPLALIQNGKSEPCPEMDCVIEPGNSLSLIVHRGFDYPKFESEMLKRREYSPGREQNNG